MRVRRYGFGGLQPVPEPEHLSHLLGFSADIAKARPFVDLGGSPKHLSIKSDFFGMQGFWI